MKKCCLVITPLPILFKFCWAQSYCEFQIQIFGIGADKIFCKNNDQAFMFTRQHKNFLD